MIVKSSMEVVVYQSKHKFTVKVKKQCNYILYTIMTFKWHNTDFARYFCWGLIGIDTE